MGEPWEDVFQQALLVLLNKQDHPSWDLKHAISFLIRTGRNLMHEAHRNLNCMPTQRLDEYLGERIALVEDGGGGAAGRSAAERPQAHREEGHGQACSEAACRACGLRVRRPQVS